MSDIHDTNHCFCCHVSSEPTEGSWEWVTSVEASTDGRSKTVVGYGYCMECNAESGPCCSYRGAVEDDENQRLDDACIVADACRAMHVVASSALV